MPESRRSSNLAGRTLLVSIGMLLSRIAGLARQTIFSGFFGLGDVADAFTAALRIPNFLQNLFGDGVLSASLIPVYARLVKERGQEEADRTARAVLAILTIVTSVIVLLGVAFAPVFVNLVGAGYTDEKRALTITLVRIMFPGVGLLVGSAWCLAVLNTHGKFFNSYAAPVLWNGAIIAALVWGRHDALAHTAVLAAWGAVIGSILQVGVQLPQVLAVMTPGWRRTNAAVSEDVREVLTSSVPVILSRGAIQVSAFIDANIASFLGTGALSALQSAQQLYLLPVSLFGMAVSSASLPSMAALGRDEQRRRLPEQLIDGQRLLITLMVPSVVGFLAFGDVMASILFQHGRFTPEDSRFVWAIVGGSAVGLIATTIGRFYASAFYALGDTKTPARFAFIRIALVIALGFAMALGIPYVFHLNLSYGTPGLTLSAGIAGWIEFALLRSALRKRIDNFSLPMSFVAKCWAMAIAAATAATGLRWILPTHWGLPYEMDRYARHLTILFVFGSLYLAGSAVIGTIDTSTIRRKLLRR